MPLSVGDRFPKEEKNMKYVISWFERPQGSPIEYENAQKRILEVFGQWKAPANFKIEFFVIRVGEWGGHMLMECDDPVTIHKFCSMLPAFVFEVHPVGKLKAHEDVVDGLETFPETLGKLFRGENFGKLVIKVADA
jgi:Protein of unknown function (DUF3303)